MNKKNPDTHRRENNYDFLRILSTMAVIVIHVSSVYTGAITYTEPIGDVFIYDMDIALLFNTLSRFAVPCFVMLSGAFILADTRNSEGVFFYRKILIKLGIPVMVFSILYFCYSLLIRLFGVIVNDNPSLELILPVKDLVKGAPFYHMWYLYMMAFVYLLVPLIILFKQKTGEKNFEKAAWLFILPACLSEFTSTHFFMWDLGSSFCYTGYFMLGYVLRNRLADKRQNGKGISLIMAGVVMEIITYLFQYYQVLDKVTGKNTGYALLGPCSPSIVTASIFIFSGFSLIGISHNFGKLPSLTFLIYLFHAGIWDLIQRLCRSRIGMTNNAGILILINVIIVFTLSVMCSVVYKELWKKMNKRFCIENRLYRIGGGEMDLSMVNICFSMLKIRIKRNYPKKREEVYGKYY